ncbi:putative baseplate protein [Bacillus phage vB_BpuM-BpSp]|nr:putative baseplate protein [Bacillus phage vB_BpuM-BpSp]
MNDFKDELLLEKNNFGSNASRKKLEALAQTIQNIIIIERGTYPNQPELGVGIENYQFEFSDDITMNELKSSISNQIERFIPNNDIVDFEINTIKNKSNRSVLFIQFLVSGNDEYQSVYTLNLVFGKDRDNSNIISKIYL